MQDVFVGRQPELSRIADVIRRVAQGEPWLVTIEGESGVGKTALVRRAMVGAPGLRVWWARADPAESDLDYGIVEQLLRGADRSVLAGHPVLAGDWARSSSFAIGAALLAVIGDQEADGPLALVIDDVQWADRRSVDALSFMFRRLSVDPVVVIAVVRGDRDRLDEPILRMLLGIEKHLRLSLPGLRVEDIAPLAAALGVAPLETDAIQRLHDRTGGHTLYLQTVLSDHAGASGRGADTEEVPASLTVAIREQLALVPGPTRSLLEMLAVVNGRTPLAQLGEAADVAGPSAAIEPAVRAGLADLWPNDPARPVSIRHALQRDAIYAGMTTERRRELHGRAVGLVDAAAAWAHRVASTDRPDETLAAQLEELAAEEAASGRLALAATRLQWASDISPARVDRERRLLIAVLHLMLAEEARGLALRPAVVAAAPSPLRSTVLGAMAFSVGQLAEAEHLFREALSEARANPGNEALAARIANRLAGTYALLGQGQHVQELGSWALATGYLDAAALSQTRTLIAIAESQVGGARGALSNLAHLDPDPARVDPMDVDALWWRGIFRLLSGDLEHAVADMTSGVRLVRQGATITLGLRVYGYLALAQYLAGAWDDATLTAAQGLSAVAAHSRRHDLPLLHLAAVCVAAGRGATDEAQGHVRLAEEAAASLDYGQERLYAAMARAVVRQAAGDYMGMAEALSPWLDEASLDGRSRLYGVLWRPLLVEGLIGSDQFELAATALEQLPAEGEEIGFLQPALGWLHGWLTEQRGDLEEAERTYLLAEEDASAGSPVYRARLYLAHGRLLRRIGQRRLAVEPLRRANNIYLSLGAVPFVIQTEVELAACGLYQQPTKRRSLLEMTGRETEVAHLVEQGMTNAEIAAGFYVTPKAVEYHLSNIYARLGLKGRQDLRRFLSTARRPALT